MLKNAQYCEFFCALDANSEESSFEVMEATVTEAISSPYEVKATLISKNHSFDPSKFIDKPARIKMRLGKEIRTFHGKIGSFEQRDKINHPDGSQRSVYMAYLYPEFWFFNVHQDYRIFQEQNVLTIVKEIFRERKYKRFELPKHLLHEKTDRKREYCVQYGESDFKFISRLLEDMGYFYYFVQGKDHEIFKLGFGKTDYEKVTPGTVELKEFFQEGGELNRIIASSFSTSIQPHQYYIMDYNYDQSTKEFLPTKKSTNIGGAHYEYPGDFLLFPEGQERVAHLEAIAEVQKKKLSGTSCVVFFSPGYSFVLKGHENKLVNNHSFTIESVVHSFKSPLFKNDDDLVYSNTFVSFSSLLDYKPLKKTEKPKIYGAQTAIVVGQGEVFTDTKGRVKVQFPWNHRGHLGHE